MYSGTFFAGRTGFVALPFIMCIFLINIIRNRKKLYSKLNKKNIFIAIICILIICFIFFAVYKVTSKNEKFAKMYTYAFELINNVFSGKGIYTTSTDKLLKMYNRDFSAKTLIIGDGKYTVTIDNIKEYYMNTDVGYYRKIFYFGIIGTILSFILEICLLDKKKKRLELENIIIFLFFILLELKGEIIGINIMVNSIIILYANVSAIKEKGRNNIEFCNSSNDDI